MSTSNGKYSLKRKVEHISIENEDGNGTTEYEIRELTASARNDYYDRYNARTKFVDGKPSGPMKIQGLQSDLLSLCLFRSDTSKAVTKEEVDTWPVRMVDQIFQKATKLNEVDTQQTAEASPKNE